MVTLSDIETIWTKFGQNLGFSLRNSVSLTPGPTVKSKSTFMGFYLNLNYPLDALYFSKGSYFDYFFSHFRKLEKIE